ncbi:MAG TPA: O-antigen ligase family protein, partial [Candidatus Caenarcaniphilales bacterium]
MNQVTSPLDAKRNLFRLGLICLPFVPAVGLVSLVSSITLVTLATKRYKVLVANSLLGRATFFIGLLLIFSCWVADNKAEAFLQLVNFLPLFWLFATLPYLLKTFVQIEQLTTDLVIISIPISVIAIIEFLLSGARSTSTFTNPNFLAGYSVVILGIELGLLLKALSRPKSSLFLNFNLERRNDNDFQLNSLIVFLLICLTFAAILTSGSRSGLIIALLQIISFVIINYLFIKYNLIVVFGSLGCLFTLACATWTWFEASRRLLLSSLFSDLRVEIWRVAILLIRQRPLFGWGLGNFRILYPLHSRTSEHFSHAHNFWLQLGSEGGIPVILGLSALTAYIYYKSTKFLLVHQQRLSEHSI